LIGIRMRRWEMKMTAMGSTGRSTLQI
jgi:hypothetical protein